jgi:hypothetical protein
VTRAMLNVRKDLENAIKRSGNLVGNGHRGHRFLPSRLS